MINLGNKWDTVLQDEFESENYLKIREFLKAEYRSQTVYPSMYDIFNAFKFTDYDDVKVVILGQDPYHERGQAHGLSFSVPEGVPQPPSLKNILKCISIDIGIPPTKKGTLIPWTRQGVMLLNTVLTVREGRPNSHKDCGWQVFTDNVIKKLNGREKPIVFLLWGANAKSKKYFITNPRHLVLEACHPSPLAADKGGFFECAHFSKANAFLEKNGEKPIDWSL